MNNSEPVIVKTIGIIKQKPLYKSKTYWINVSIIIGAIVHTYFQQNLMVGLITIIMGFVNIFLRMITTHKINFKR